MSFFDFSYFYLNYLKSKNTFGFNGNFGCLEGGCDETPHLLHILNPTANRNNHFQEEAEIDRPPSVNCWRSPMLVATVQYS